MTEPVATSPKATAPSAPAASLKHLYSVAEVRTEARRVLPLPVFDFGDGGAEDERTLRRNEQAFDDVALLPRPLNGAASRDLSVTLFGKKLSMPLGIGPTGLSGLFWPDGECEAARAATAAGVPYIASHGSVCTLEDIAAAAAGPRWMQVFVYTDRGFTARDDRACGSGEIRRAGSHHRQPVARQPRARHPQRLFHSAALRYRLARSPPRPRCDGCSACGRHCRSHLRQLSETRREGGIGADSRPHGQPARSRACPGPTSTGYAPSGKARWC